MNKLKQYVNMLLEAYLLSEAEQAAQEFDASTKKASPKARQDIKPATPVVATEKFSVDGLKQQTSLEDVISYLQKTIRSSIGEGEGRIVFQVDGQKVVKAAKNLGGIAQNKAEGSVCDGNQAVKDLFPVIFEQHPNGFWLLTQYAAPMTTAQFQTITGLGWNLFLSALKGAFERRANNVTEIDKQNFINASNNPFFTRLVQVIKDCNYEPGDIVKLGSWGIINGKAMIIDSGFTESVYKTFYKDQAKNG